MQIARMGVTRFPLGNAVEVLVVALDPVKRLWRIGIRACPARNIADAEPDRNVRVPIHGGSQRLEVAVDVGDGADQHELSKSKVKGQKSKELPLTFDLLLLTLV